MEISNPMKTEYINLKGTLVSISFNIDLGIEIIQMHGMRFNLFLN